MMADNVEFDLARPQSEGGTAAASSVPGTPNLGLKEQGREACPCPRERQRDDTKATRRSNIKYMYMYMYMYCEGKAGTNHV